MSAALVIGLVVVMTAIAVHLVLAAHERARKRAQRTADTPETAFTGQIPIQETGTYRETKEHLALLRAKLDAFNEAIDAVGRERGAEVDLPALLARLDLALVEARNAAARALSVTLARPAAEELAAMPADAGRRGQGAPYSDGEADDAVTGPLLMGLRDIVNEVTPAIAGFYFSLTNPDEEDRVASAAAHLEAAVASLDSAIRQLRAVAALPPAAAEPAP